LCGSRLDGSNSSVVWRCRDGTATEAWSISSQRMAAKDRPHVEAHRNAAQCAATKHAMPQRFAPRYQCTPWRNAVLQLASCARLQHPVRQGGKADGTQPVERGARLVGVRWEWAEKAPRVVHGREKLFGQSEGSGNPREKTAHIAQRQSGQAALGAARAGSSGMGERAPRNLSADLRRVLRASHDPQ
jgi:hypothetical protein